MLYLCRPAVFVGGLVLSIGGCGSTVAGGTADASIDVAVSPDVAVPIDAALDAFVAPPRCDPTKPFGAPTVLPNINGANRDIQAILPSGLTIIWATDRSGTLDLYTAARASETVAFGTPVPIAGFAGNGTETSPYLTGDGLTMYYAFAALGVTNADIYVATRATTASAFTAGTALANVNTADDDGDVTVTADGNLLYFASQRSTGTGGYDLYVAVRGVTGTFGTPQLVAPINSTVYDAHPRVTADGLRLYYSSMRTDGGALAGTDVWTASRASTAVAFGTPTRVAEINTASNESPTWISADGCVILLQTDRAGGSGGQDVWEAVKPL